MTAAGKAANIRFNNQGETVFSREFKCFQGTEKNGSLRMGNTMTFKYSSGLKFRSAAFPDLKRVVMAASSKKFLFDPSVNYFFDFNILSPCNGQ